MVLAASSDFFRDIFSESSCKQETVFLSNFDHSGISALLDYMYKGEINMDKEEMPALLELAKFFKVRFNYQNLKFFFRKQHVYD